MSGVDRGGDRHLRLPDGRKLGFRIYGDPKGTPILFLHGTPGSRLKFSIAHEFGKDLRLAIVAPDRWGLRAHRGAAGAIPAPVRGRHGGADGRTGPRSFEVGGIGRRGSAPRHGGAEHDLAIFLRPWQVDLAAAPHRRACDRQRDSNVPIAAARILAPRIPRCILTELPNEGHLWVSVHHADVLAWVASAIGVANRI